MDGNKDAALKCLGIGKEALASGDRARAVKFLSKARRLDPTLPIDDLLASASAADGGEGGGESPENSTDAPPNEPQGADVRSSSTASSSTTMRSRTSRVSSDGSSKSYTEEQITIVRQIKKEKDYYKILGLEKGCTVEDVRKAYRKLSLKVHPDKNNVPGSDEAFKAVSKAFQCLSNEESRKRYDLVGSEEPDYGRVAARHRGANGFNGFYEADIDPDEIFRQFFFGGMAPAAATPFGTFRFRTGGMGGPSVNGTHGNFNLRALLQLLPVILFLLFNFLPSSEPLYSFSRSYPHEHKVETPRGVPYYVKLPKFEQDYPYQSSQRIALEQRIEREYYGILAQNCRLELQRRSWGLSYQTPHCDMLQKFEAAT